MPFLTGSCTLSGRGGWGVRTPVRIWISWLLYLVGSGLSCLEPNGYGPLSVRGCLGCGSGSVGLPLISPSCRLVIAGTQRPSH